MLSTLLRSVQIIDKIKYYRMQSGCINCVLGLRLGLCAPSTGRKRTLKLLPKIHVAKVPGLKIVVYIISGIKAILQDSSVKIAAV
jgi:hypothetical protein